MKIQKALIATVMFVAILIIIYYLHINFFKVDVVFYAAIVDGVLAALISGAILYFLKYFSVFNCFEKLLLFVIWIISAYTLAISVPTVIDRSLSFYILEKLQQRGGGIKQESFKQVFTEEYVKEHRLMDVRLTEQLESGTIVIEDGCVLLTEKGKTIATFGRYFRKNWLPKQRLLMGEYSADLTDPFKVSDENVTYTCSGMIK
ncbi:MAG: hypothetical protein GX143_06955 [Alcaligenaceae bacterium]|jgi:hypothetical protein|nr:hypothetical protein [Alcaligenaceae bacterium]